MSSTCSAGVSLGGSAFFSPPDHAMLLEYAGLFRKCRAAVLVPGGGQTARLYISSFPGSKLKKDMLGIMSTKLNALYFSLLTGIPIHDRIEEAPSEGVSIVPGQIPGITTDAVAALAAEKLGGAFINLTKSDGVLKGGRRIEEISYSRLFREFPELLSAEPGRHFPLDITALAILKRSSIRAYIGPANDIDSVRAFISGRRPASGTVLVPDQNQ